MLSQASGSYLRSIGCHNIWRLICVHNIRKWEKTWFSFATEKSLSRTLTLHQLKTEDIFPQSDTAHPPARDVPNTAKVRPCNGRHSHQEGGEERRCQLCAQKTLSKCSEGSCGHHPWEARPREMRWSIQLRSQSHRGHLGKAVEWCCAWWHRNRSFCVCKNST